jgi:hypothetical protein
MTGMQSPHSWHKTHGVSGIFYLPRKVANFVDFGENLHVDPMQKVRKATVSFLIIMEL